MSVVWVCQRCLLHAARPLRRQLVRHASATSTSSEPISPILLAKARAVKREHSEVSRRIAQDFDTKAAKRLSELSAVANALRGWETAVDSLEELKGLLQDRNTDPELRDLATADIEAVNGQVAEASQALTIALVPRHPFEDLPCLVEIRPGVGGSEAALFAGDLLRMYQSFCNRHGLRMSLLKYESSDGISDPSGSDAPMQEAVLEVQTKGAYGILRSEAGVHRVQRVPATESKGRTHTSAASVLVLPSFPENGDGDTAGDVDLNDPKSDSYINPQDVRTDVMRARGAGGQHVNTTDSAVRLTHVPTNTVVAVQDTRSQHQNRAKAWQILRARLAQARREAREEEMVRLRRSVVGVAKTGRTDKIRTYNWGQQRVTDHRSGVSVHDLDDVMGGGPSLERIMDSVRAWFQDRDIQGLLADDADASTTK